MNDKEKLKSIFKVYSFKMIINLKIILIIYKIYKIFRKLNIYLNLKVKIYIYFILYYIYNYFINKINNIIIIIKKSN